MITTDAIFSYVLGLALGLVLPEAVARLVGGAAFFLRSTGHSLLRKRGKGQRRILCLGDSMTDGRYPSYLEAILREKGAPDFSVRYEGLNRNLVESKSSFLSWRLRGVLKAHEPDIAVIMIGIHDNGYILPYFRSTWWETLKIYELVSRGEWLARRMIGQVTLWYHLLRARRKLRQGKKGDRPGRENSSRDVENGCALLRQGRLNEAEKLFEKAIESNPAEGMAYFWLGWIQQERIRLEAAERAFTLAIKLNPEKSCGYSGLGWFYQDYLGWLYRDYSVVNDMQRLFEKALETDPRDSGAHTGLGWIHKLCGNPEAAERCLRKAVELNPDDSRACVELALLYGHYSKTGQAEEMLKKAIASGTRDSRAHSYLGRILLRQARHAEAKEMFLAAIEINPRDREAYAGLWWACSREEARERYRNALKENPPYEIHDLLCRLLAMNYLAAGDTGEAEKYFHRAKALSLKNYNPVTRRSYREMIEELSLRKIKVVLVQYPLRSVEALKKLLADDRGVTFVDNEQAFKEALSRNSIEEYFTDLFAGDFGHCTDKGDALIANNVANAILNECHA